MYGRLQKRTLRKTFLYNEAVRSALIKIKQAVASNIATASKGNMKIQKLPYIIFRAYPDYGYLTDNRNYGYDTACKSSRKVGELIISKVGSVFYSVLENCPQTLDEIVNRLCTYFEDAQREIIYKDAQKFYSTLSDKGFICCCEDIDKGFHIPQYLSYQDKTSVEIPSLPDTPFDYDKVFGEEYRLHRVHLDISSRCNEKCIHCYIPDRNKNDIMDLVLFDEILQQCIEMRVLNITISGGEPMMNPNLIKILEKCHDANFSINLLTNLNLLSDDLLEVIVSNPLLSVQTSLYSMDEEIHDSITKRKGSCRKTMDSIIKLWDNNVPMQINCPIMIQNKTSYSDVIDWATSMNIESSADYVLFGCYDGSQNNLNCRLTRKDIKELYESNTSLIINSPVKDTKDMSEEAICPVCKSSLCISNTGKVYPCEGWQELILGDLTSNSLSEIWNCSTKVINLRNLKYKDFSKCISCNIKEYCNPCLIMNANENPDGDYMKVNNYLCEVAELRKETRCKYHK